MGFARLAGWTWDALVVWICLGRGFFNQNTDFYRVLYRDSLDHSSF